MRDFVKDISKSKTFKLTAGMGVLGLAAKGVGLTVGIDILTNWAALDNVMGQQSILVRDLVSDASFNKEIDINWVKEKIAESEEIIAIAEAKISGSVKWDPALWVSKKLWLTAIEGNRHSIEIQKERLTKIEESRATAEPTDIERRAEETPEEKERRHKAAVVESEARERKKGEREGEPEIKRKGFAPAPTAGRGIQKFEKPSKLGFGL